MAAVAMLSGIAALAQQPATPTPAGVQWASFRGNGASGVVDGADVVESFDGVAGTNLAWKTAIPGMAHSSPIVWDDRIYVTTAVSDGPPQRFLAELPDSIESVTDDTPHRWVVMALDRLTERWCGSRLRPKGSRAPVACARASFANATPATDGATWWRLFGSQGLFCYDTDGNLLWSVDLGVIDAGWFFDPSFQWGSGSFAHHRRRQGHRSG